MTHFINNKTVLVTGGSGFIAVRCMVQLLQQDYTVRATLRTMERQNEVKAMLTNARILQFYDFRLHPLPGNDRDLL